MVVSEEEISQRKLLKHRGRNVAYHFQLPAYVQIIRRLNAAPLLDLNMVTLLEVLLDRLQKLADFNSYRPPDISEVDLRQQKVAFTFGCGFCNEKGFNARQSLEHVMNVEHNQLNHRQMKKLQRFKKTSTDNYQEFLFRRHEMMGKNNLQPHLLDGLFDFYVMTKNFLKMTTRYLSSLSKLEWAPSIIVAQGVLDLLNMIDLLLTKSKCIESVPRFTTILQQLLPGELRFVGNGKIFDHIQSAIDHVALGSGLKMAPPAQGFQNVFTLPPIGNGSFYQLPPNMLVGPPIVAGPGIPAFTTNPPVRMLPPPPIHLPPPPMMSASMMRLGIDMQMISIGTQQQQRQQFVHQQQLLFNPSVMRMTNQQQQMAFQQPPPQIPPPMSPTGTNTIAPIAPIDKRLPPIHQTGSVDCPTLSSELLQFLTNPNVDSLIENGNNLIFFAKSSVIPCEIKSALKAIAPDVRVECFGAKVSGVGYEEDSVNLYIDDAKYPKTAESVKEILDALKAFFIDNNDEWVIQNIQEADVQTHLTVKNTCENISCRVTFAGEINCHNSTLIHYYVKSFPMYQKLCYFVQEFIKLGGLDLNRYIIIVLVLFYLQKRDYLPTIAQLQSKVSDKKIIGNWLVNFIPRKPEEMKLKPCETDLRKSASDFFLFYGKQFSFQESVVCPQIGLALNRTDFLVENMWKMPLKQYKVYVEECMAKDVAAGNSFDQFAVTSMCVQDPLALTTNIASQVTSEDTGKFTQLCHTAYNFYLNN
ncbi:uncharacterized protein LOC134210735 [Armigeres subalbatus]|uniref:uncharacterized protein LOC134210735 n=1 Tax=Armigeres subalbatus TaxID=124917 RepID=UPI002ED58CF4